MRSPRPSHAIPRAALLICMIVTAAQAQLVLRLKDINTSNGDGIPRDQFPFPAEFATLNGITYFRAVSGAQTTGQLWRTDGTAAGTVMFKDIDPIHGVGVNALAVVGNTLFIFAGVSDAGELWKSDGTAAGTIRIKVFPNAFPQIVGSIGNVVLFATGSGLWRSDGTESGTFLVKDVSPSDLVAFRGALFFVGSQAGTGRELWKTDGTAAGTVVVKDILPGPSDGIFLSNVPVVVGNTMYFMATEPATGSELWKSDGTAAGTVLVKDINPGTTGSLPSSLTAVGATLAFIANEPEGGSELWKSDGTAAGTVRVKDIVPGPGSSSPAYLTAIANVLYFRAFEPGSGIELWKSDGTEIGTVLVKDIEPGAGSSAPMGLVAVGNTFFFAAVDSEAGSELWRSDGTEAGTFRVKDIFPGAGSSTPLGIYDAGGFLLFTALTPEAGVELWRTDGSSVGTSLIKDINLTAAGSSPTELTAVGDTLFFQAFDPKTGAELWKSDGTPAGTVLIKDINPGPAGSMPFGLTPFGNMLLFFALEPNTGIELWKSDGTPEGTVLVKDVITGPNPPFIPLGELEVLNGEAFFLLYRYEPTLTGFELWKSDGTEAGTTFVSKLPDFPADLTAAGNGLFFTAGSQHSIPRTVWENDGTSGGTFPVGIATPASDLVATSNLMFVVRFFFTTSESGTELWRSDGTLEGTFPVLRVVDSGIGDPTPVGDTVFFTLFDAETGGELWKTDGTIEGTMRVKDIVPGSESSLKSSLGNLIAVDDLLFFDACTPTTCCELWKSDGTEAGTVLVKDISPGPGNSIGDRPFAGADANGVLFFNATNGSLGFEPWISGGSAKDTFMLQDIAPGSRSSSPDLFTPAGDNVFFVADDGVTGRELWVFHATDKNVKFAGKKHPKEFKGNGRGHNSPKATKGHSSAPDQLESVLHQIR